MRWITPLLPGLFCALLLSPPALAASIGAAPPITDQMVPQAGNDHNLVREMMRRGEIWSLDRILASIEQRFPDFQGSKMVAVAFHMEARRYDLTMLSVKGGLLELRIDARDGAVLNQRLAPAPVME